jgi:RNA polymerase sigma factor (sigma-70 family)
MDLGAYYESITKEPLLSKEQEYDLFLEMNDNSISEKRKQEIQDKIIRANLRFVFKEAKRRSKGDPYLFEELIAAGNDGLIAGMSKYDPDSGYRFLTYSGWWVLQRMLNVMGKQRIVSLPIWRQQLSSRIERVLEANEDMTFQELKTYFPDVPEKDLKELFETRFLTFYIEDMGEDREFQIDPIETIVNTKLDNERIHSVVEGLPDLHRQVIQASFGLLDGEDKRKPADIAKELGISRDRFKQIKREALEMLKSKFGGVNPF